MSENLQNRLNQFEVVPPASCWKGIAERLDSEYIREDVDLAARFTAETAPVPPGAWSNIAAVLDADANPEVKTPEQEPVPISIKTPVRRFVILQRIAAIVLIALGVTFIYRYSTSSNGNEAQPQQMATTIPGPPAVSEPVENIQIPENTEQQPRRTARPRNIVRTVSNNLPTPEYDEPAVGDMRYANIDNADKRITALPINIPTEPIRDGDGNIIMDEKLVSTPDNNYVTVTGPNGSQTRISKKFLRALSYMNAGATEEEQLGVVLQESALWKWLFQEWRTRLIQEPSFIPSSTNFLDILEMKDLLHDNL